MDFGLEGRLAFGAGRGIGKAIALDSVRSVQMR